MINHLNRARYTQSIVLLLILGSFVACSDSRELNNKLPRESVHTISYGPLRSGYSPSALRLQGDSVEIEQKDLKSAQFAIRAMPLFHVFPKDSKFEKMAGREVIFFTHKAEGKWKYCEFIAVDINTDEVLWSVPMKAMHHKHNKDYSVTGVIDPERGRIYFKDIKNIYTTNLDGSDLDVRHFDIKKEVNQYSPVDDNVILSGHACNAAMSLVEVKGQKRILFGCSTPSSIGVSQYGDFRGLRGTLYSYALTTDGKFSKEDPKEFFPSKITKDKRTGYNTGIWNSGIAPAILEDGTLLVATGNGPVIPEEENFGCSVVRVKIDDMSLYKNPNGSPSFYSIDTLGTESCYTMNLDLSSSAVAVVKSGEGYVAAVTGKDGIVRVFDPDQLPGASPTGRSEFYMGGFKYGQPLIRNLPDGGQQVIVVGNNTTNNLRLTANSFFATEAAAKKLQAKNLIQAFCAGLVLRKPEKGSTPLHVYFNGFSLGQRILSAENTALTKLITSRKRPDFIGKHHYESNDSWPPFAIEADSGHSIPESFEAPRGFRRVPIRLSYTKTTRNVQSLVDLKEYFEKHIVFPDEYDDWGHEPRSETGGDILIREEYVKMRVESGVTTEHLNFCGDISDDDPKYEKVYYYVRQRRKRQSEESWAAHSFIYRDGKLSPQWLFEGGGDSAIPNSNVAATRGTSSEPGLVFIVALRNREKDPHTNQFLALKSDLIVLNAATGKEVGRHKFEGQPHFSMPLIVGNQVFVPTRDKGIRRFLVH